MEKKCNWCYAETRFSREDFVEIKWSAVKFGNAKMVCACPEHQEEMRHFIRHQLR